MSGKKVKILLVEDNPADVRLIREMLSEEKETRFELESANLLSVALEKIAKPGSGNGLDLILLDLGLPDSIGFDTFLKTHAESSELPIIILTVMDDQELAVEAVRGGAQDYLVKGQMNSNLLTRSIRYAIERKRAEEDLRKSQNYFRSLIENSFDTIMILDQKAVIQYVSPPVQRILGYARGEGLSQSALVFIHPEDHKYVMEKFAECVQNPGMIAVINLRLRHKDGSWRLVEATGRSLFHDPAVKGFIINFRDITEHKQMEDALRVSEQRFQRAITAMEGGLWEWDLSTNQEFFSPRWCEIIGYSVDDPELPHTYNSWAERIHPDDSERVMSALKNHLEKGAKYDVDYRHRHKSGEYRWQNSKGLTIFDERGKPEKMVGCISDITVRKRAERAVADKNRVLTFINNYSNELLSQPPDQINDFVVRRLKDFTGAAAVLITSYDAKSSDLVVQASTLNEEHNSLIFRLLGKQIIGFRSHVDPAMYEEITTQVIGIRQSIHEVTFGAVPKPIGAAIQAALGISWFTGAALTKDKQLVGTLMIVGNAETSPLDQEFLSTFSSITGNALERKRTEEELRESEQRYATLFRNAAEGILVADIETKVFVYANPAICRMLGYSEEEIKRLGVQDIHPAESLAHVLGVFEAQALGKKPFSRELPCRRKDGSVIYADIAASGMVLNKRRCNVGFFSDVTERKRAEEELLRSETKFRTLYDTTSDAVMLLDQKGFFDCNQATLAIFGFATREEFCSKHPGEVSPPRQPCGTDSMTLANQRIATALEKGSNQFEWTHKRADTGAVFPAEVRLSAMELDGKPVVQAVVRDITVRKRAEEELKFKNLILSTQIETSMDGILVVDQNGKILSVNRRFAEMWGIPDEVLESKSDQRALQSVNDKLAEPERFIEKVKYLYSHPEETSHDEIALQDGRIFDRYSSSMMGSDRQSLGRVWYFRDITLYKKNETELMRAEKLESLSLLAGGIAHDFNNLLAVILGNLSLSLSAPALDPDLKENLQEAETASSRAKELIRQLLTFAKGGAPIRKAANIVDLIKESTSFAISGSNVRAEFFIPGDLWPVEVDLPQISQVISNLAINAVQAMPKGGTVKIMAENVLVEEKNNLPLNPGRYIKVSVRDQGIGISEENLDKIFDPYFTTKKTGSGLGLATTYSIIKKHDGLISVESKKNAGTNFYFYLPASLRSADPTLFHEENLVLGSGRILVMDDEEIIRNTAGRMLKSLGYEVELAEDGEIMLELYRQAKNSGHPFDAVIMDLTIPGGMGGKEAIRKLLKLDPDAVAIVSSGYSNDQIMAQHSKYGFSGVVVKPYKLVELGRVLNDILTNRKQSKTIPRPSSRATEPDRHL